MNETNLGKIHVFPSEDSYNSNKESVGSSDLALVPNTSITGLSVSGKTITYTKGDGTTGTITTQDTTIPSSITSKISVTAGTIGDGKTIPLPSGYSRSQCKYAVWPRYVREVVNGADTLECNVNQSTGVVTITNNGGYTKEAGYVCIAVK